MMLSLGAVNTGFIMDDDFANDYETETEKAQKIAKSNNENTNSLSAPGSSDVNMSNAVQENFTDSASQKQLNQKPGYNDILGGSVNTYDRSMMLFHIGFRTIYGTATSYIHST